MNKGEKVESYISKKYQFKQISGLTAFQSGDLISKDNTTFQVKFNRASIEPIKAIQANSNTNKILKDTIQAYPVNSFIITWYFKNDLHITFIKKTDFIKLLLEYSGLYSIIRNSKKNGYNLKYRLNLTNKWRIVLLKYAYKYDIEKGFKL